MTAEASDYCNLLTYLLNAEIKQPKSDNPEQNEDSENTKISKKMLGKRKHRE